MSGIIIINLLTVGINGMNAGGIGRSREVCKLISPIHACEHYPLPTHVIVPGAIRGIEHQEAITGICVREICHIRRCGIEDGSGNLAHVPPEQFIWEIEHVAIAISCDSGNRLQHPILVICRSVLEKLGCLCV